jgi:chloramphenicol-sensitive protein RarD
MNRMTLTSRPSLAVDSAEQTVTHRDERSRGKAYGLLAHAVWGVFPLYFHALEPAGAWEVLAHRVMWTLVVCAAVLLLRQDLAWVRPLLVRRRLGLGVVAAALLIATNWVVYVYAVVSGHVIEAALGYFLNPLVTVAVGVVILREPLRRLQWLAVGIGFMAAAYLTIDYGKPPWISLVVALTFAFYGLTKKLVGTTLTAMHSLAAETAVLLPVALVILLVLDVRDATTFLGHGPGHTMLLLAAGVLTAIPMLLFGAAARRIPLSQIGLLQFVTPVLQLLCGVLLLGENMPPSRWIGFGIVWIALAVLSVDAARLRPGPPAELSTIPEGKHSMREIRSFMSMAMHATRRSEQ